MIWRVYIPLLERFPYHIHCNNQGTAASHITGECCEGSPHCDWDQFPLGPLLWSIIMGFSLYRVLPWMLLLPLGPFPGCTTKFAIDSHFSCPTHAPCSSGASSSPANMTSAAPKSMTFSYWMLCVTMHMPPGNFSRAAGRWLCGGMALPLLGWIQS